MSSDEHQALNFLTDRTFSQNQAHTGLTQTKTGAKFIAPVFD